MCFHGLRIKISLVMSTMHRKLLLWRKLGWLAAWRMGWWSGVDREGDCPYIESANGRRARTVGGNSMIDSRMVGFVMRGCLLHTLPPPSEDSKPLTRLWNSRASSVVLQQRTNICPHFHFVFSFNIYLNMVD